MTWSSSSWRRSPPFVTVSPIKVAAIYRGTRGVAREDQWHGGAGRRRGLRAWSCSRSRRRSSSHRTSLSGVRSAAVSCSCCCPSTSSWAGRSARDPRPPSTGGRRRHLGVPAGHAVIAGPARLRRWSTRPPRRNGILATVVLAVIAAIMRHARRPAAAETVQGWLGHTGILSVRILGILLAAVSAEMILTGLRDSIFSCIR